MAQKNLVIAFGGVSPEHEVSVLTAMQAMSALENSDYNCIPLYFTKSGRWLTGDVLLDLSNYKDLKKLESQARPCHFSAGDNGEPLLSVKSGGWFSKTESWPVHTVLVAFHGSDGENGSFQGICEMFNIPYTGSGVLASSIGMDKVKSKEIAGAHGVNVVPGINFYEKEWVDEQGDIINVAENYGYPLVVKPVNLGSSIGVALVHDKETLVESVETAFRYDAHILIEKAINPLLEINCSVMGTAENCMASVCEQPLGREEALSFQDKYLSGDGADKGMASADRIIPADISDSLTKRIQDTACKVFSAFGASGLARLDFLIDKNTEEVYFNEINTIPGSFSFYLWDKNGLSFPELMNKLIDIAADVHRTKNGRVRSYDTNLLSEKAAKGIKGLKGGNK